MPNKDLRKYNKGASSLPMKAEGKAPLFFHFFAHFLLRQEILEEVVGTATIKRTPNDLLTLITFFPKV
jgi:hypothetical protein